MINDKVVFVLGAGASIPYGFPSGGALASNILAINKTDVPQALGGIDCQTVLQDMGLPDRAMLELKLSLRLSQVQSIDAFLAQPTNQRFLNLGRFLISALLIPCEDESKLFENQDTSGPNASWYKLLWNNLLDYQSIEAISEQLRLTFITFNYDRSLEHFLYTVADKMFTNSNDGICSFLKQNVFHVHGKLGEYNRIDPKRGRRFIGHRNLKLIRKAMDGIRVIHEVGKFPDILTINRRIEEADRLVFLGFAYAPDNLTKLLQGVTKPPKRVMGTSFGLSLAEITTAKRRIANLLSMSENSIEIEGDDSTLGCHDWLRKRFEFS